MSDEERARLEAMAAAAEVNLSEFLRDFPTKTQVVNRADWQRRTFLLCNLTNNLNQLVRWANAYKSAADAHRVVLALMRLERDVRHAFDLGQRDSVQP